MSLILLADGWKRYGSGRKWRCASPGYLCEVDIANHTPNYFKTPGTVTKIRRIKAVYAGKIHYGLLDQHGRGLDILVANALAESFGTVPSPLSFQQLQSVLAQAAGNDPGVKLDTLVRYIGAQAKYLQRREPGYINPLQTAQKVSVGAHHVLISTALSLLKKQTNSAEARLAAITDLMCRLPSESLYAAELAVRYFNQNYARHANEPPLLAATYNAGSPRPDSGNLWNLRQYGDHLDRWVSYYNTSCMVG